MPSFPTVYVFAFTSLYAPVFLSTTTTLSLFPAVKSFASAVTVYLIFPSLSVTFAVIATWSVPAASTILLTISAEISALVPVTSALASVTFPAVSFVTITVTSAFSPEAVVAVTFFDSVVCSGLSSFFVSSDGVTVAALPEDELSEDELPEVFVSSFPSEDDASLCRYSTSTAPHPPSSCSTHTRSFTLFVLSSVKVTFGVCQSPHAVIAVVSPVNSTLSSSAFNICMVTSDCAPWAYASNV